MKKYFAGILTILFCCCLADNVFSQADAGEDKITCKGGPGVKIGGAGDPSWCYTWKPETGLNDPHAQNPIASPDTKTTYTVKVVGPDFSFTDEDEVIVYVAEKVKLEVEKNITQCMEKREVTYTATIEGDLPNPLPEEIEFIFHYKRANGTEWSNTEWSYDKKQDNTVVADNVPDGNPDHKFTTPIYAEVKFKNCNLKSDVLNIDVYKLWIDYVRYAGKAWQVVVGQPFEYNAIASTDCKNWVWDMEDGVPDTWNPPAGNAKTGTMTIPTSDLPSGSDWNYFGKKYGTVNVSCEDEEGNKHNIYSTDQKPSAQAKVYFPLQSVLPSGNPAWYDYWSYALGVNSEHKYNGTLATSETAVTSATNWTIQVGSNAHWSTIGNDPTNNMFINGYWATNLHEFWHRDHRVHNFQFHGGWNPPAQEDLDGDGICDRESTDPAGIHSGGWEAIIGTNPNVANSTEDGGNWAETKGVYNHQSEDWAFPGSNW